MTMKTLKQSPVIIEYNSFTDSPSNVLTLSVVEPRRVVGGIAGQERKEDGIYVANYWGNVGGGWSFN